MTETSTWGTPECPFVIEYSTRTLDDIRLAVVDAFFSLPRGGAEIGGILLGKWEEGRLTISDHLALDCEHAYGPSFALSPRDESILAGLITASETPEIRPVGWYHSHTRSEIFLSEADLDLYRRFFPEPWQVALVLKPHTFLPARAGFFFRDAAGLVRNNASYREITIDPLAVQPAPARASAAAGTVIDAPSVLERPAAVVEAPPPAQPEPVRAPDPPAGPQPEPWSVKPEPDTQPGAWNLPPEREPEPRQWLPAPDPKRARRWPKIVLPLATVAAMGAAAYMTRDSWMPRLMTTSRVAPTAPPALGLNTLDSDGQLQIRWNSRSPAVLQAPGGVLFVGDGGPSPERIALDQAHLLSGAFTIARRTERVDVTLSVIQPDGGQVREVTAFSGKLPEQTPKDDSAVRRQRDELAEQVTKTKASLQEEIQRNRKLQRSIESLNKQLHEQQRMRMLNQTPAKR